MELAHEIVEPGTSVRTAQQCLDEIDRDATWALQTQGVMGDLGD